RGCPSARPAGVGASGCDCRSCGRCALFYPSLKKRLKLCEFWPIPWVTRIVNSLSQRSHEYSTFLKIPISYEGTWIRRGGPHSTARQLSCNVQPNGIHPPVQPGHSGNGRADHGDGVREVAGYTVRCRSILGP